MSGDCSRAVMSVTQNRNGSSLPTGHIVVQGIRLARRRRSQFGARLYDIAAETVAETVNSTRQQYLIPVRIVTLASSSPTKFQSS
jgi:hypothetical protein